MRNLFFIGVLLCSCAHTVSDKELASARISYDLGVASLEHGDHRESLRALLAAVKSDPYLAEAHNALGLVLHALGKQNDALEHYQEAIRLKENFSEAYNNMGILLLSMSQYDEAIAAFSSALGNILYGTPYLAEGNMGWALYKKGAVEAGIEHIGNAVASHPKFCRGYEWLARIAMEQNKPQEMISHGQRFVRHCLDDPNIAAKIGPDYIREMQYYLGVGHLLSGNRKIARTYLSLCANDDPEAVGFAVKCAQSLRTLR